MNQMNEKRKSFAWLRPWQWPWWMKVSALLAVPAIYLLSATPAIYLCETRIPWAHDAMKMAYQPAWWCEEHSTVVCDVFRWQWTTMIELCPPPKGWREAYL